MMAGHAAGKQKADTSGTAHVCGERTVEFLEHCGADTPMAQVVRGRVVLFDLAPKGCRYLPDVMEQDEDQQSPSRVGSISTERALPDEPIRDGRDVQHMPRREVRTS